MRYLTNEFIDNFLVLFFLWQLMQAKKSGRPTKPLLIAYSIKHLWVLAKRIAPASVSFSHFRALEATRRWKALLRPTRMFAGWFLLTLQGNATVPERVAYLLPYDFIASSYSAPVCFFFFKNWHPLDFTISVISLAIFVFSDFWSLLVSLSAILYYVAVAEISRVLPEAPASQPSHRPTPLHYVLLFSCSKPIKEQIQFQFASYWYWQNFGWDTKSH